MTALAASAAVYPAQAHSCRAAEAPRRAFVARARLYKSRCDQPRAAAQPATPVAVAVAAAASGGNRQRRQRLHAAVGQAQAVEERHGDWVLTVQVTGQLRHCMRMPGGLLLCCGWHAAMLLRPHRPTASSDATTCRRAMWRRQWR